MPDTADYPRAVLGHTELTNRTYNTSTYTTWFTPLQFPRPARGVADYPVQCSYCGRVVRWRVLSAARTRGRRWSWVGVMLFCAAVSVVAIKVGNYQTGGPYGPEPYAAWGGLLAVVAGLVFLIAAYKLIVERGVRVRQWLRHRAVRPRSGMTLVQLPASPTAAPAQPGAGS